MLFGMGRFLHSCEYEEVAYATALGARVSQAKLFIYYRKYNRESRWKMEQRIAILGIIVEDADSVERVNELLHEYREYIIGRMGMPYRERGISVISIVMDTDTNTVSALSGKLGMVSGVSAKAVYSTSSFSKP